MGRVFEQPVKVYRVGVPLMVVAWLLAGLGGGDSTPSTGGLTYRVASTAWAVFFLTMVLTLLFTATLVVRRFTRRSK